MTSSNLYPMISFANVRYLTMLPTYFFISHCIAYANLNRYCTTELNRPTQPSTWNTDVSNSRSVFKWLSIGMYSTRNESSNASLLLRSFAPWNGGDTNNLLLTNDTTKRAGSWIICFHSRPFPGYNVLLSLNPNIELAFVQQWLSKLYPNDRHSFWTKNPTKLLRSCLQLETDDNVYKNQPLTPKYVLLNSEWLNSGTLWLSMNYFMPTKKLYW